MKNKIVEFWYPFELEKFGNELDFIKSSLQTSKSAAYFIIHPLANVFEYPDEEVLSTYLKRYVSAIKKILLQRKLPVFILVYKKQLGRFEGWVKKNSEGLIVLIPTLDEDPCPWSEDLERIHAENASRKHEWYDRNEKKLIDAIGGLGVKNIWLGGEMGEMKDKELVEESGCVEGFKMAVEKFGRGMKIKVMKGVLSI